ncbi:hypothetical protein TXIAM_200005 [Tenacibaculum xiamenense]
MWYRKYNLIDRNGRVKCPCCDFNLEEQLFYSFNLRKCTSCLEELFFLKTVRFLYVIHLRKSPEFIKHLYSYIKDKPMNQVFIELKMFLQLFEDESKTWSNFLGDKTFDIADSIISVYNIEIDEIFNIYLDKISDDFNRNIGLAEVESLKISLLSLSQDHLKLYYEYLLESLILVRQDIDISEINFLDGFPANLKLDNLVFVRNYLISLQDNLPSDSASMSK